MLLATLILPPPEGMALHAWYMVGVATMMGCWWMSKVLPIPMTALLPIVLVPLLGIAPVKAVTAPYAHPIIYLFLGGFMLGIAMERWGLHKRIALYIMLASGTKPAYQIGGFMLATAFLSMWVSNTATTVMMLPIGLSVAYMVNSTAKKKADDYTKALLLGIAYSASIGGVGTLIGTPPNALLAAFLQETYQIELGFSQWMLIGVPVSLLMLLVTWVWLTRFGFKLNDVNNPLTLDVIEDELTVLGPMSRGEKIVLAIFCITSLAWITRPFLSLFISGLSDTVIAIFAAVSMFLIPVDRKNYVLSWDKTKNIPWGILLLFGGGLTLASLIKTTGLAEWVAGAMGVFQGMPIILVVALVVTVIIFLTELTSNTATAAGFLPLVGALALTLNVDPMLLAIPTALAASCAFMMPVATPPNAIVFWFGQARSR